MCGIAGVFRVTGFESAFNQMFDSIAHRGPSASGVYRDSKLQMGMHRLKFRGADIPLPIWSDGAVSAYNGQLYGHFGSDGDFTEIEDGLGIEMAVASQYGPRSDGMYAYSTYSSQSDQLRLSTDPHFIKPLFYHRSGTGIAFCSELAPLLRVGKSNRLNLNALVELFAYGWYLSDQTFVDSVSLVWKNDVLIDAGGMRLLPKVPQYNAPSRPHQDINTIRDAIKASVYRSTRGTGPLGLALSGGLDSSILAWELNDLKVENLICITVCTDDGADGIQSLAELNLPAGGAWLTWKHVVVHVDDADFLDLFEKSTRAFGQPTTMSSLPLYQKLADSAAAEGVRALILGEGVDEYFAGYSSYAKISSREGIFDYYRHLPRERIIKTLFGSARYNHARQRFMNTYGSCTDLREIEIQMRLTRLLLRCDVSLMSRSIEGRVPFLHSNLPALAMSIPWNELSERPGKTILRAAYAEALGQRASNKKERFKSPDSMLLKCLTQGNLEARIVAAVGLIVGRQRVEDALAMLRQSKGFDADVLCLLMSLTFLIESGVLDDFSGH